VLVVLALVAGQLLLAHQASAQVNHL
jgi:hypothetical protein